MSSHLQSITDHPFDSSQRILTRLDTATAPEEPHSRAVKAASFLTRDLFGFAQPWTVSV